MQENKVEEKRLFKTWGQIGFSIKKQSNEAYIAVHEIKSWDDSESDENGEEHNNYTLLAHFIRWIPILKSGTFSYYYWYDYSWVKKKLLTY